jgi:hypothetical protein
LWSSFNSSISASRPYSAWREKLSQSKGSARDRRRSAPTPHKIQRWRRIEVDPVVIAVQLVQQFAQLVDLVLGLKLGLQIGQLSRGGDDVQVVERGFVDIDLVLLGNGPEDRVCLKKSAMPIGMSSPVSPVRY